MRPLSAIRFSRAALPAIALASLSISCSKSTPLDPLTSAEVSNRSSKVRVASLNDPTSSGGFYPLAVGNRWHHSRILTLDYHGYGADTIYTSIDRVISGTEAHSGRTYYVEETIETQGQEFKGYTRYRQDRAGLYVLRNNPTTESVTKSVVVHKGPFDRGRIEVNARLQKMRQAVASVTEALDRASGPPSGADSSEIPLLSYPLHVGSTWSIPEFAYPPKVTVEAIEVLNTPAGRFPSYRIRIDLAGNGPEDFELVWYGRAGLLARHIRLVTSEGYPANGFTADEREVVDHVSISR